MLNFKTQRRIQNTKQQNANQETKPKGTPKTVRDTFWTKAGGGFEQNPPVYFQNPDTGFETQIFLFNIVLLWDCALWRRDAGGLKNTSNSIIKFRVQ